MVNSTTISFFFLAESLVKQIGFPLHIKNLRFIPNFTQKVIMIVVGLSAKYLHTQII